jgi:glucokinase
VHRGCSSTLHVFSANSRSLQPALRFSRQEGDELSVLIVEKAIHKLAAALAGLLHIFDPEAVILGGPGADAGADLLVPLQQEVWDRTRGLLGREVPLIGQEVADRSGIVSAAGLVMAPRD